MDLEKLLQIAFRRKELILGIAATAALLVFLLGKVLLRYEAQGSVLVKPIGFQSPIPGASRQALAAEIIQPAVGIVHAPRMSLLTAYGDNFTNILTSPSLIRRVVTRLELDKEYSQNGSSGWLDTLKQPIRFLIHGQLPTREISPLERAIDTIAGGISAEFIYKTSIIQLFVKDETASQAVKVANTLLDEFVAYSKDLNIQQAKRTTQFLEEQLTATYAELKRQRQLLAAIKETYGVPVFSKFADELIRLSKNLDTLESEYEKNTLAMKIIQDRIARLNKETRGRPEYKVPSATTGTTSPYRNLLDLQKKLLDLRAAVQIALIDYAPNSPQVTSLQNQIALAKEALEAEMAVTSEAEMAVTAVSVNLLLERIQEYREKLTRLAEASDQATAIESAISTLESQGVELQSHLDMIKLLEVKGLSEVQVLDWPIMPRYPKIRGAPLAVYVFTGFCAGLIMAVVGVVWQEQRYTTSDRNAEEDVQSIAL